MASDGLLGGKRRFKWTSSTFSAIFMILGLSAMYYHFMHSLHLNEIAAHPAVILAMPPLTIAWGISVFPLLMFLSYQDEFNNVNPLVPSNYKDILVKALRAMAQNNYKVKEKDL